MNNLENTIYNIVKSAGVELYDIEKLKDGENGIFRVYIKSKDGITLDKCSEVSNLLSPILDINEPLGGKYFFEVSSPGLERKLRTISHFEKSIGDKVEVKLKDATHLKGEIKKVEGEKIFIDESEINFNDIKSAKTYFEW